MTSLDVSVAALRSSLTALSAAADRDYEFYDRTSATLKGVMPKGPLCARAVDHHRAHGGAAVGGRVHVHKAALPCTTRKQPRSRFLRACTCSPSRGIMDAQRNRGPKETVHPRSQSPLRKDRSALGERSAFPSASAGGHSKGLIGKHACFSQLLMRCRNALCLTSLSLDVSEKAGIGTELNRCRALAAKIANELRNKRPEHFVDKLLLADIHASLEHAADVLSTVKGSQVQGRQRHR